MSGQARTADVAVIGAGPVGLFTVFALGQVGLSAVLIDAQKEVGGQCAALYPEKPIYDIPSRVAITGGDLVDDLVAQAAPYDPIHRLGRRVVDIDGEVGAFTLRLDDGEGLHVGAVIAAAGAGAFGPNRPPLAGLEAYEGTSVFYAVRDAGRFRGSRLVIAGGGDSAVDWALFLVDVAASLTLVHRRAVFRAAPGMVARLEALVAEGRIRLVAPGSLAALEGTGGGLSAVHVDDGAGGLTRLDADHLLCCFGLAKDLSAIGRWGLEAGRAGIPVDPTTQATARRGVFAVGDIATHPGKLKLILSGFAEAAAAAHGARAVLRPGESFHFEYSTSRGRPVASLHEAP